MRKAATAFGVGLALASAQSALAHHSAAMFDAQKDVTVQGTVKAFQYTNPHSWLIIDVPDTAGKMTEWSFEAEGPSTLMRAGIKGSSLMPGDKVTVKGHPMKDGRPGAALVLITKADGTMLSLHGSAPAPLPSTKPVD